MQMGGVQEKRVLGAHIGTKSLQSTNGEEDKQLIIISISNITLMS